MDLGNIFPTHGKQASIGGKGHTRNTTCLQVRPEQSTVLHVPQLDRVIPTPCDQLAAIRAEGEGSYPVRMGLPDAGQGLSSLFPEPHFPPPAGCGPVLSIGANGYPGDGIEGRGPDALTHHGSRKGRVLQLDALQVGPANGEPREVQAA